VKTNAADGLARFAELNKFVTERHGWIVSLPGDTEVRLETLPDSTLPDELRRLPALAVLGGRRSLRKAGV